MAPTRSRRSAHDPGRVLRDLIVMIADGGDCVSDLAVLRDQYVGQLGQGGATSVVGDALAIGGDLEAPGRGRFLVTDQPSNHHEERTRFGFDESSALVLEFGGEQSRFTRQSG